MDLNNNYNKMYQDHRDMAREWGQFMETISVTEHKASIYDTKNKEVSDLQSEVASLKKKVKKLEAEKKSYQTQVKQRNDLCKEQLTVIGNFLDQVKNAKPEEQNQRIQALEKDVTSIYNKFKDVLPNEPALVVEAQENQLNSKDLVKPVKSQAKAEIVQNGADVNGGK